MDRHGGAGAARAAGWFRLVDLEPGDGLGGGAGDLGDQAVRVVDPPGAVGVRGATSARGREQR
jgi:hypothetical protein